MSHIDKNNKTFKLTLSALFIALGTALSFIKIFTLPLGAAVTLFSMLPICLLSLMYGFKYSLVPCMLFGAVQMFVTGVFGWGLTPSILIGSIAFDYIFAFGVLSLSGIFRKRGEKGMYFGIVLAAALRFICHFLSGCIFFRCFDYFGGNPYVYSLCYNGAFMLPELLLTVLGAFLIFRIKPLREFIER